MSDYERHIGKIRKVIPLEGEDIDSLKKRLCLENGELEEDDYDEYSFDDLYEKYFEYKGIIWEIFDHQEEETHDSYCTLHDNKDGTYSFSTYFYNGGTYLTEMLQDEIKKNKY